MVLRSRNVDGPSISTTMKMNVIAHQLLPLRAIFANLLCPHNFNTFDEMAYTVSDMIPPLFPVPEYEG